MSVALIRDNDVAFAYKALNLVDGLSVAARRVGAAIIDHFNRKTGQCDPSVDRLATLLDMHRATVMRATEQLHEAGLIECVRHGSRTHRNAYLPVWDKFNSIVANWAAKMSGNDDQSEPQDPADTPAPPADTPAGTVARMRPSQSHGCDFDSRTDATLTIRRNHKKEPLEVNVTRAHERKPDTTDHGSRSLGLWNRSKQTGFDKSSRVACSVPYGQVAEQAANSRWEYDLRGLGWVAYGKALEQITPEIANEATAAEIKRRGDGLRLLCTRLSMPMAH
ncbi:helix-turn-helix domain-containing protein [Agrobacterium vitis]|uniref:Helix-turn-helix domain-containing protein n=1 Tax=Agrobacterium vitis TaxID=373 RepID=A0AAE4WEJ3_AGRVI|nr:helix-turn-helix domain-containing protein [Allorhizobium sp. Av2]MUZ59547.1 helix-turn-helix domain-containing protein [Agrobacterium vitis]MVA66691.1 helix-turn-helix domain-containing protein [Agrobacterium vitis]MVA87554.1 helix-turn-helix domain-containing protein [Agrobacterium vitis]